MCVGQGETRDLSREAIVHARGPTCGSELARLFLRDGSRIVSNMHMVVKSS